MIVSVSVGSSVPMARITSTNLNSAPEIQLSGGAGQFRLYNQQIGSSTVVGGEQIRVGPDQILNIVAPTSPRFQERRFGFEMLILFSFKNEVTTMDYFCFFLLKSHYALI